LAHIDASAHQTFINGAVKRLSMEAYAAVAYSAAHGAEISFAVGSMTPAGLDAVRRRIQQIGHHEGRDATLRDLFGDKCMPRTLQPFESLRRCTLTAGDIAGYIAVAMQLLAVRGKECALPFHVASLRSGTVLRVVDDHDMIEVNVFDHLARLRHLPRFAEADLLRIVLQKTRREQRLRPLVNRVVELVKHGKSVDVVHAANGNNQYPISAKQGEDEVTLGTHGRSLISDFLKMIGSRADQDGRRP